METLETLEEYFRFMGLNGDIDCTLEDIGGSPTRPIICGLLNFVDPLFQAPAGSCSAEYTPLSIRDFCGLPRLGRVWEHFGDFRCDL